MSGVLDYMQLCRLCLVKDKVNVPIFGDASDVRQIFLKITACLPVKVSQDDNLPKSICDTCLYKVDLLYQFWNTSVNAEKQLIQWLGEIGVDVNMKSADPPPIQMSHAHPHSITPESIMLKEERHDSDVKTIEGVPQGYIPPPQLVYGAYNAPFAQANASTAGIGNNMASAVSLGETTSFPETSPTLSQSKRTRGRPASKQLPPTPPVATTSTAVTAPAGESMDEDSSDRVGTQDDSDDSMEETGGRIAKEEAESEEEYDDNTESLEPTTFVGVPSTTSCDTDQPGPSGLNKPPTTTDTGTGLPTPIPFEFVSFQPVTNKRFMVYKCDICPREFSSNKYLRSHKVAHLERTIPCDSCSNKFKNSYQRDAHIRRVHTGKEKPLIECDICGKKLFKGSLKDHRLRHLKLFVYKCIECDKGFHASSNLKEHIKIDHRGVRYICFPCNKSFRNAKCFSDHMEVKHNPNYIGKDYVCHLCNKICTNYAALRKHLENHKEKKLFVCDVCGKGITTRSALKDHIRLHTGEKPHACETCGKTFSSRNVYTLHLRTHTKERPYSCKECDKTFTQRSSLVIHLRYHTGERPYRCNFCEKDFVSKTLLTVHTKVHGTALADL